jgi:hypothetical protein
MHHPSPQPAARPAAQRVTPASGTPSWPFGQLTALQQRDRARLERRLKLDALVRYPEALW